MTIEKFPTLESALTVLSDPDDSGRGNRRNICTAEDFAKAMGTDVVEFETSTAESDKSMN